MDNFLKLGFLTVCVLLLVTENLSSSAAVEPQIPGGVQRIDVYDSEILKFVNLGREKFSASIEASYEPIIVEVTQATKQVVSGMLYRIDLKFAESTCKRGEREGCTEILGGKRHKCTVEIWSRPWVDNGSPSHKINCETSNSA